MNKHHCPVIHGALQIDLRQTHRQNGARINSCCLRNDLSPISKGGNGNPWTDAVLQPLRDFNLSTDAFHTGCWNCESAELSGLTSFRTGMLEKYGYQINLSGPQRLDLMVDTNCNLACRTCGPGLSTYWQKHLKDNNLSTHIISANSSKSDDMIDILKQMDLTNLQDVVFCGGETLLGQSYWKVAEALIELAPIDKLTLSFQTNGTIALTDRNFEIMSKFHLVKFNVSIDGVGEQFEYLRWPAKWDQLTANIQRTVEKSPVNVMFLVEETISIFNLYYQGTVDKWVQENFSTNRLGDIVNHTKHMANETYRLDMLTQEYIDALPVLSKNLVNPSWQEQETGIAKMINQIQQFDLIRNQDWRKTFPEVAGFYSRYI